MFRGDKKLKKKLVGFFIFQILQDIFTSKEPFSFSVLQFLLHLHFALPPLKKHQFLLSSFVASLFPNGNGKI